MKYKIVVYDGGRTNGVYEENSIEDAYNTLNQLVFPSMNYDRVVRLFDDQQNIIDSWILRGGVVVS